MKIDHAFIGKLLPTARPSYEGLKVVMNRWLKIHPETINLILGLQEADIKMRRSIHVVAIYSVVVALFWFSNLSKPILPIPLPLFLLLVVMCWSIVASIFLHFMTRFDLDKYEQTRMLQRFLDVLEDTVFFKNTKSTEMRIREASFSDLKMHCETKAFDLAEQVLNGEATLAEHIDDDVVATATNERRKELNCLHQTFAPVGLLDLDLGKYYKKEISQSKPVGMEKD